MKLTKKQFREFRRVNNLRAKLIKIGSAFLDEEKWEYGLIADCDGEYEDDNSDKGILIFIPYMPAQSFGLKVKKCK